ncbi:MAG: DNA polymerase I, partial [Thermoleophilia bacterium]|nr:DNA polymerase I [Thermoleophilia bacterium]
GRPTIVVTGDRDALQLVGRYVRVMMNTRGITEVKIYDPAAVEERFGVPPALIPDFIGLKGDSSDNIPGVPGIGEKTAAELLKQFGSLEAVLEHVDEVPGQKRRELLQAYREDALLSKKLARLEAEVPIDFGVAEATTHRMDRQRLEELLVSLEFTSVLERLRPLWTEVAAGAALPQPVAAAAEEDWEKLLDWGRPVGV